MSTFTAKQPREQARVESLIHRADVSASFEFFPPKSEEAAERLYRSISELIPLEPTFVSVTYGAGGTTRRLTHELVIRIRRMSGLTVVPHLTCLGCDRDEIARIVGTYYDEGIRNILALRGDPPREPDTEDRGLQFDPAEPVQGCAEVSWAFPYAADLVRFIRREFPDISIGAACYPEGHRETPNRLLEMEYLRAKVDAGVDWLVTQLFFDNREFYDFEARCRLAGIEVPILAGIMPITSRKGMFRMAELSPGTRFPAGLLKAIGRVADDAMVRNVGTMWATGQVLDLLENEVDGIHFYTLNRSKPTLEIYRSLGLADPGGLEPERASDS